MADNSKFLILGIIAIVLALGVSLPFVYFLAGFNYLYLLISIVFGMVWLGFFTVQTIFVKDSSAALVLIFAQALTFVFPAFLEFNPAWLALAGLSGFFLFAVAYFIGQRQLNRHLKISFAELRRHMLPLASITLTALMVAVYFISFEGRSLVVSRHTVALIARPLTPVINKVFPGFVPEKSLGDFFESLSIQIYGEQSDPQLFASQLRESISQAVGVALTLNETVINASGKVMNSLLEQAKGKSKTTAVISIAILLFILISGATFFINIIAAFLAWMIFQLLLSSGFGYITSKETRQEVANL